MNFRLFTFIFTLVIGSFTHAQKDSLSTKYREDQFFLSFSMILQQESIQGFKQNGFSNNIQMGFIRDIPLNKKGDLALGWGLGYGFHKFVSNLNLDDQDPTNLTFSVIANQQNKQTFSSLFIPIEFRLRTSTIDKTDFWRFYGGFKYKFNFSSRFNYAYGGSSKEKFIRDQNAAVYLSLGYNTWNLFFEYDLNSIYKDELTLVDGIRPNLRVIKIGLIFYVL